LSPQRRPSPTPLIPPPRHFVERRATFRREADRLAHEESALLARALDVLAAPRPAEERLAELLDLIARTVGAERAAVLAEGEQRIVAVAAAPEEPASAAEALAAWLDASAPRPRAARAAAPPAAVAFVARKNRPGSHRAEPRNRERHYLLTEVPGGGGAVLGFEFRTGRRRREGALRLPPALARHAAVALALVSRQVAEQRELADLEAREAERSRFVSMVAHELRTPLTSLSGYLDLILEEKVSEPEVREEFLERSRDLVSALSALVADVFEMSRLDSGNLNLALAPFSAAEVAQSVIDRLMPQAMARQIALRGTYPSRLRTAFADRQRSVQILTNLVANAIKFTPSGGTVELRLAFDGGSAVYAVRDDGPGISDHESEKVFERFYRSSGVTRVSGSGLGLAISRELARAMDGDLDLATCVGCGSSFVFVLPDSANANHDAIAKVMKRQLDVERRGLEGRAVFAERARLEDAARLAETSPAEAELLLIPGARSLAALRTRRLRAVNGSLAVQD
jgi:signal transduction histidine kinase